MRRYVFLGILVFAYNVIVSSIIKLFRLKEISDYAFTKIDGQSIVGMELWDLFNWVLIYM